MNLGNFLAELRRRNVYKVAVAYAVVGWLVIQAASIVLPTFHAPEWVLQTVLGLVVLGFPIALIIAWAFELTPEGVKRTEADEPVPRRRGGGIWIAVVVIGALLSIGLFFLGRYTARHVAVTQTSGASEKSIAVLPFNSLSKDEENAFFADGVQDQVLANLAKIAGLKVISRTSVMQYRNPAARNLREIAQQLGVVHVLEGSVQRVTGKVRVTAQLIDARNDAHEWAENYDRPLDDIFAIQSEIAKAIADQLQVRISPQEAAAMAQAPTTDLMAHNLYLKARELNEGGTNDPNGKRNLLEAVRLLSEALERDPRFFLAYCLLALTHDNIYWAGFDHTAGRLRLSEQAIENAARLQPQAGELHLARALYSYHAHRDYDRARAELELARQALPNNSQVYYYFALIDRRQARWEESLKNLDRTLDLDPRNFEPIDEAGLLYGGLRRFPESNRYYERALELRPDYYFVRSQLALNAYLERADIQPIKELIHRGMAEQSESAEQSAADLLLYALLERDQPAAMRALAAIPTEGLQDPSSNLVNPREFFEGLVARLFGDTDGALAAFTSARGVFARIVQEQPDYAEAWSQLGVVDASLGRKEDAILEGRHACDLLPLERDAIFGPYLVQNLALIYTWTSERDLALEQLRIAAKVPYGVNYGELKLHPQWDSLHGDPRFEQIVASLAPKGNAENSKK